MTGLLLVLVGAVAGCAGRTALSNESPSHRVRQVTFYVANSGSDTVTPILYPSNRAGRPIKVGSGPQQILMSPDGRTAYVASHLDLPDRPSAKHATLTAIRTATNTASKVLTVCKAAESERITMAITPDGRTLYYLCPSSNRVIPVNTRTLTIGKPINAGCDPTAIAITPDGETAYVANGCSHMVIPIDTATNRAGTPIKVGLGPTAIAITPNGKTAYAVDPYNVTPITVATSKAGRPIIVRGGVAIAITPDGSVAYVVTRSDEGSTRGAVVPIRVATNAVGKPIKVGTYPFRIAITPDGTTAYVTSLAGTITPIRVATDEASQGIKVGRAATYLAITPDSRTVYVVDTAGIRPGIGSPGSVIPVDIATGRTGKPIWVGPIPLGIAVRT